ncbi:MAG: type II toxin-antitoxin system PemK/MazF family toxin [Bryobacterales bacterium]|nr:type II toxin-antitoxin system PemK/MazF family toxin [Bryobacterales bacterium]
MREEVEGILAISAYPRSARRSEPGYQQPVLVIQANSFDRSRIQTAIVAAITSNIELAEASGNVLLPARCRLGFSAPSMKGSGRSCKSSSTTRHLRTFLY